LYCAFEKLIAQQPIYYRWGLHTRKEILNELLSAYTNYNIWDDVGKTQTERKITVVLQMALLP